MLCTDENCYDGILPGNEEEPVPEHPPIKAAQKLQSEEQWEKTKSKSPVYHWRERCRESLETKAGAKFIVSTLPATAAFYLAGPPVAEGLHTLMQHYTPELQEIGKMALDWDRLIDLALNQAQSNAWILIDLEETMRELKKITFIPEKHFERIYLAQKE